MSKKNTKKAAYASINTEYANSKLEKISTLMDQLRKQVGKKGDGANGGSTTLIGAVEGLNKEAYDGAELTKVYKKFNTSTLPTFKTQINNMDFELNVIDALAK